MKRKDLDSIKELSREQLLKRIEEKEKSLDQIARERYTKQSKNVKEARNVRVDIAQLKTILRQKELLA